MSPSNLFTVSFIKGAGDQYHEPMTLIENNWKKTKILNERVLSKKQGSRSKFLIDLFLVVLPVLFVFLAFSRFVLDFPGKK